jgi:hypothetical protein
LSDTGILLISLARLRANQASLTTEPIVAFWSDYATKRRWFCVPDKPAYGRSPPTATGHFQRRHEMDPKHFDLELERGNHLPRRNASKRACSQRPTAARSALATRGTTGVARLTSCLTLERISASTC